MSDAIPLVLTPETYHSLPADRVYMSSHQFTHWIECPAREAYRQAGNYSETMAEIFAESSKSLAIGSYVDCALTQPDRLGAFMNREPERWLKRERKTKKNPNPAFSDEPTATLESAQRMVDRAKRDELFMAALKGQFQVIICWQMFGMWWKAMLDLVDEKTLTAGDLKTTASISKTFWSAELKLHVPFYENFNYWRQFAIYREGFKAKYGKYPEYFFMPTVSSETPCDIDIFLFDDIDRFETELRKLEEKAPQVIDWKTGKEPLRRCEECDYCRETKVLKTVTRAKNLFRRSPM